jgi:hypothetical protein
VDTSSTVVKFMDEFVILSRKESEEEIETKKEQKGTEDRMPRRETLSLEFTELPEDVSHTSNALSSPSTQGSRHSRILRKLQGELRKTSEELVRMAGGNAS